MYSRNFPHWLGPHYRFEGQMTNQVPCRLQESKDGGAARGERVFDREGEREGAREGWREGRRLHQGSPVEYSTIVLPGLAVEDIKHTYRLSLATDT